MEKKERKKNRFGLIGRNISYSFSQGYFTEKFDELGLKGHSYENFDLEDIAFFPDLIAEQAIKGLNVTIPYKEEIIPYLDCLDAEANSIGAVNTIKFTDEGLVGYNTDAHGFQESLKPHLKKHHKKALVLGTGGASKAITYVLDKLGIDFCYVSRTPSKHQLSYIDLNRDKLEKYQIIINCSPVGTYPNTNEKPDIPYHYITNDHLLFDLIYNPSKTSFLKQGERYGAMIQNGLPMLQLQAEKAWQIWTR